MNKQKQNLKKRASTATDPQKKCSKKEPSSKLILGCIIGTFLTLSPYLFYFYESVPDTRIWKNFLFVFDSHSWNNAKYAIWTLLTKLIPCTFLFIWFFTCRHWWYHSLIAPIAMYTYQILTFFNNDIPYIDEFQLIHLIPVMAIVLPSIYLMRAKIFNEINTVDQTTQDLEDELAFKPKNIREKFKQYF